MAVYSVALVAEEFASAGRTIAIALSGDCSRLTPPRALVSYHPAWERDEDRPLWIGAKLIGQRPAAAVLVVSMLRSGAPEVS